MDLRWIYRFSQTLSDKFCLFLGGKLNESETCGLGLELDLNLQSADFELDLQPVDLALDLTISASEDLVLEE